MVDLLPCPFCGGTDVIMDKFKRGYAVCCETETCDVIGPEKPFRWEAAEAWNRRAQLAPPEPLPEDVAQTAARIKQVLDSAECASAMDIARQLAIGWHADRQRAVEAALRTLLIFRAFVQENAAVWAIGSGHHHPVWQMVAETLSAAGLNDETVDHALICARGAAQEG